VRRPPVLALPDEHGNIATALAYVLAHLTDRRARLLDLGCRFGSLLANLHLRGFGHVYGLDVDADALHRGQTAYPDIAPRLAVFDGKNIPFGCSELDTVTMFDVFEHLIEPDHVLGEVRRVLRPGGRLLFQTPNLLINVPWEIIKSRSLTLWRSYHGNVRTLWALKGDLRRAGFRNIAIDRVGVVADHNIDKVRRAIGRMGLPVLPALQRLPLALYPNFYGVCVSGA
jgi:SAM-dependent methyltransferase